MYVCKGGEGHQVLEQPRFLFTLSFMQDNPCRKGKQRLLAINYYIQMGSMSILRFKRSMECIESRAGIVFSTMAGWMRFVSCCHLDQITEWHFSGQKYLAYWQKYQKSIALHTLGSRIPSTSWFPSSRERERGPIRIQGNGVLIRLLPAKPTPVLPNVTTSHWELYPPRLSINRRPCSEYGEMLSKSAERWWMS